MNHIIPEIMALHKQTSTCAQAQIGEPGNDTCYCCAVATVAASAMADRHYVVCDRADSHHPGTSIGSATHTLTSVITADPVE